MSKRTPWAHLPNAKHIDAVLEEVRARPEAWRDAWDAARDAAVIAAWDAAWDVAGAVARDATRGAAWNAAWNAAGDAARDAAVITAAVAARVAARDTLVAIIAWDSSADLLECTPDVLRTMVDLAEPSVCHQAALLLPYAIVRANDKQEVT